AFGFEKVGLAVHQGHHGDLAVEGDLVAAEVGGAGAVVGHFPLDETPGIDQGQTLGGAQIVQGDLASGNGIADETQDGERTGRRGQALGQDHSSASLQTRPTEPSALMATWSGPKPASTLARRVPSARARISTRPGL